MPAAALHVARRQRRGSLALKALALVAHLDDQVAAAQLAADVETALDAAGGPVKHGIRAGFGEGEAEIFPVVLREIPARPRTGPAYRAPWQRFPLSPGRSRPLHSDLRMGPAS